MTAPQLNERESFTRWQEAAAIVALTAWALLLRAWHLDRVVLGQYDEGVYAISGWGLSDSHQLFTLWPGQERFSPPVYFSLVSVAFRLLGGPSDRAAVLVNVILGTLTVPVTWWVARRWFGAASGLAAAALVAGSEFHIIMSRSGLTDVSFALVFLVAIAAVARWLEDGSLRWAMVAGLATGLAWNTKYHGWFALVAAAGAIVGRWWLGSGTRQQAMKAIVGLLVAIVVAWLCYLPWMLHIGTQPGAIGGWTKYFAGMLSLNWPRNFLLHVQEQAYLEGPWTRASVLVAAGLAAYHATPGWRRAVLVTAALALLTLVAGGMGTMVLLGLLVVPIVLKSRERAAPWVLLAWLGLWVAVAPMYRPYFRLLLPFLVAVAIAAGHSLVALWRAGVAAPRERRAFALVPLGTALLVYLAAARMADPSDPWRPNVTTASFDAIARTIPRGARVSVVGEPSAAFYLRLRGYEVMGDLTQGTMVDTITGPAWLVGGVYSRRSSELREAIARRTGGGRAGTFSMDPTEIRILDDFTPGGARTFRAAPDSTFALDVYAVPTRDSTRR